MYIIIYSIYTCLFILYWNQVRAENNQLRLQHQALQVKEIILY